MDDVNSSGDLVDYMGVNNGTKQGDANQVDNGKFGKGFEFDGDGDYVDVGEGGGSLDLGSSATWSAWIHPVSFTDHSYHTIISKRYNGEWWLALYKNTGRINIIHSPPAN